VRPHLMNTNWFATMAQNTARAAGSSSAFIAICGITLVWMVTGPVFHWSDTWQLVINTVTNIVSMLMVFLIQNTQNRESSALQLKIDELLRAVRGAQNAFINLEDLSEEDLNRLKKRYAAIAVTAEKNRICRRRTSSSPPELPRPLRNRKRIEISGGGCFGRSGTKDHPLGG